MLYKDVDAITAITAISALSVLLSLCVILTTLYNVKLNSHPYGMITNITIIDASYIVIFGTYPRICQFQLPSLFVETIILPYFTYFKGV